MSGVIPVSIVTTTGNQIVDLSHGSFYKVKLRIIDTAAKAAGATGGLIPMTQATYDALIAAGSVAA
jgi:hypothetical protein